MRLEVDHLFRGNARGHGANGFSKAVGSDERASEGTCIYFMVAVVQYLCNEKVDGTVSRSWRPCTRSSPLRQSLALLQRIARRIIPLAVGCGSGRGPNPTAFVRSCARRRCMCDMVWYHTLSHCPMHHACCMVTVRYCCCCFSSASGFSSPTINNRTCGTLGAVTVTQELSWCSACNGQEMLQLPGYHRHAAYMYTPTSMDDADARSPHPV